MKISLSVALAVAAMLLPAQALADSAQVVNDPHAPASLISCDVEIDSDRQGNAQQQVTVSIDTNGIGHKVESEITLVYDSGRTVSTIIASHNIPNGSTTVWVPRLDAKLVSTRCAVATATTSNGLYIAPWLPKSVASLYTLVRDFDLPPVPEKL